MGGHGIPAVAGVPHKGSLDTSDSARYSHFRIVNFDYSRANKGLIVDMERELLLLGMLREQAMHGYQLHELIEGHLGGSVQIKKSTTYNLLSKMTDTGWVTSSEEQAGNRPPRRVYTITAEGEGAFLELVRQSLAEYKPMDHLGSIGLAFLDAVPRSESIELLRQRRISVEQLLVATQSQVEHAGSMQMMIENQIRHVSVELEWLDEVIGRIEDQRAEGDQSGE